MGDIYQQIAQLQTARERRRAIRFLTYWERLKGLRDMPHEGELEPEGIELLPFWEHCFVIRAEEVGTKHPEYTYLGAAIIDAYKEVLSPEDPGDLVSPAASKLLSAFRRVVDTMAPLIHEGQHVGLSGRLIKYRQCLVPLGKVGKVEAILGLMSYTAMPVVAH